LPVVIADYHKTIHQLISSESISCVRIINRALTEELRTILWKKLPGATHLRTLDLSFNEINGGNVSELFRHLSPSVKKIVLRGAKLRYASLQVPARTNVEEVDLSESCIQNPTVLIAAGVRRLILASNSDFLKPDFYRDIDTYCDMIESLDLSYCSLGDQQVGYLASFLSKNPAEFKELDISGNPISASGIIVLASTLERNQTLRLLKIIDTTENFTSEQLDTLHKIRPTLQIITEREPL
jgi:hypothetical protein